uniref:Uncharacterized protein n=1 Tax=Fagus sylvatica TaxID=28930 RepID=A0A2N9I4Z7_FAGSY
MTKTLVFFINQQTSTMVPEKMVHGSISQSPEKLEKSWSSTPPSGPRRITQWSTANYPAVHKQTQSQKQLRRRQLWQVTKKMTRKMRQWLKRLRNLPWPSKSVPSEMGNDEKPAGYFLYPLVMVDLSTKQSTAAPAGTK